MQDAKFSLDLNRHDIPDSPDFDKNLKTNPTGMFLFFNQER